MLVYGAGNNTSLVNSGLRRSADRQSSVVVGYIPVANQSLLVPSTQQLHTQMGLSERALSLHIDEVVVAPDERRGGLPMDEMLSCAQGLAALAS